MNPDLLKKYKNKFEALKRFEIKESRKLSIGQKFQQFSSLFSSAAKKGSELDKNRTARSLQSNWAVLKG